MSVLVGIIMVFMIHVFGVYWWYGKDDLVRPLVMLPPKEIPPFWHAIFMILVNGNLFSLVSFCDYFLNCFVNLCLPKKYQY
jgi:hypothetical protein